MLNQDVINLYRRESTFWVLARARQRRPLKLMNQAWNVRKPQRATITSCKRISYHR
ncbi:hypothetical protein SAMN04488144_13823 [Methylobacterium sp. 190mf]|nr:hypothetical protein SAMN04488144_13823 [Methylobacterium sp. 190mf]